MDDSSLDVRLKVIIAKKDDDAHSSALGSGVVRLCELVEESGSLNKAAKEMGMAYSKAWRILKETEEALGLSLLDRNGPKGSMLTADGKRLIAVYRKVTTELEAAGRDILKRCLEETL